MINEYVKQNNVKTVGLQYQKNENKADVNVLKSLLKSLFSRAS